MCLRVLNGNLQCKVLMNENNCTIKLIAEIINYLAKVAHAALITNENRIRRFGRNCQ